ncbi:MAG: putative periplasmic serine endoprotease DegP-like [Francisellaceae bacterium]|nr:putative periplasmic serine endoprotease DegP-like [Francisellaceae bacterium]
MKIVFNKKLILSVFVLLSVLTSPYLLGQLKFYSEANASNAISSSLPSNSSVLTQPTAPITYADSVDKAAPAVVSIKTSKEIPTEVHPMMRDPLFRHFFGEQGLYPENDNNQNELHQGLGSGVIINSKGYVLTNYHVIKEADTVTVALGDGRQSNAVIVGSDPDTDLAVLKIDLDKLPVITLGSSATLRTGDVVLAIGNPFGLDQTVTQGIISATQRSQTGIGLLQNFIQTDAAINPGNSGGALVDAYGRLIGINTLIYSRNGSNQGIGFAIPIDLAKDIMEQLMSGKRIVRGWLGVSLQNLTKEIKDNLDFKGNEGIFIRAIVHNSPAQKAGLLPGDVITKINNQPVKDANQATHIVTQLSPNKAYPIELVRKKDTMTFSVVIGERQELSASDIPKKKAKEKLKELE